MLEKRMVLPSLGFLSLFFHVAPDPPEDSPDATRPRLFTKNTWLERGP